MILRQQIKTVRSALGTFEDDFYIVGITRMSCSERIVVDETGRRPAAGRPHSTSPGPRNPYSTLSCTIVPPRSKAAPCAVSLLCTAARLLLPESSPPNWCGHAHLLGTVAGAMNSSRHPSPRPRCLPARRHKISLSAQRASPASASRVSRLSEGLCPCEAPVMLLSLLHSAAARLPAQPCPEPTSQ